MSLTVKVYFEKESGQPEIRRFSVDQQVASNVEYLKTKIRQIFPDIGAKNVTLYWKDPDNDLVMFSTDDELTDALGYVNGGLLKVYIKVCADQKSRDTVHPGVKCDGCECDMIGYRYKCLICPDFDLCETCQTKGCHSEHNMMCIRTPQQYHGVNWVPCGPPRGPPHMGPPPQGPKWNQPPPRRFFKRMFREHMKNYAKMSQDSSDKEETETGAGEKKTEKDGAQQQTAEECLKNVYESLSAMLDPLGIDVSIDVHPDRGHHRSRRWGRCGGSRGRGGWGHCGPWFGGWQGEGWCGTHPSSQPTAEKETDVEMSAQETSPPHGGSTCCGTENMADQQKKKSDCCGAGGGEGGSCDTNASGKSVSWTFIDNQQSPMIEDDCSKSPKRDDQPSTSKDNVTTSSAPEQPNVVASSLQRMKQMGFTDESGWLTHLLQMKNGSIEQVLEIIQPNK